MKIKSQLKSLQKKGFFDIFFTSIIVYIISFCQSIIIIRLLSKADYGVFAYVNNIISILCILDGLGAISALLQLGCEHKDDLTKRNAYASFAIKYGLGFNVFVVVAIVLFAMFADFSIPGADTILLIMCAKPLLNFVYSFISVNLRIDLKNSKYALVGIVYSVCTMACLIVGAVMWGIKGIAWMTYLAYIVTILISIVINKKSINYIYNKDKLTRDEKKEFVNIAFFSSICSGSGQLLSMADVFLIGLIISDSLVLADYKVAMTIPVACMFVPFAIMTYCYPILVDKKKNINEFCSYIKKVFLVMVCCSIVIGLCLIFGSKLIVSIIFGKQYLSAVSCFIILSFAFMVNCMLRPLFGNLLSVFKMVKTNFVLALVTGIINIGLDVLFIVQWGSIGAAFATLLSMTIDGLACTIIIIIIINNRKKQKDNEVKKENGNIMTNNTKTIPNVDQTPNAEVDSTVDPML